MRDQGNKDQPGISLLQASGDDNGVLLNIQITAFKADQFSNLMLWGRDPDSFRELMSQSIAAWTLDPKAHLIKAVNDSGDVVGWSCWIIKDEAVQESAPDSGAALEQDQIVQKKEDVAPDFPRTLEDEYTPRDLSKRMRAESTAHQMQLMGNGQYMILQALFTDPRWQRNGIGSKLVQWGAEKADAEGLACWAHASPAGYSVYRRAGFKEMGRSEYDLDLYSPKDEQQEYLTWGKYTFRYMVRAASA